MGKISMFTVALALAAWGGPGLRAADLAKIERQIGKEPAYSTSKPEYCLLVFGAEAKTRMWIVLDGRQLFVDRNGNGDLTDPGERVAESSPASSYFHVGAVKERNGVEHPKLTVSKTREVYRRVLVYLKDGRRQYAGWGRYPQLRFAASAARAPIIHFNGPMSFDWYGPQPTVSRSSSKELRLMIGTPGLGEGTFAPYLFRQQCWTGQKLPVEVTSSQQRFKFLLPTRG